MQKSLRSTRRGWMIFNEAEKGGPVGGGGAAPVAAAPEEKKVEPAAPVVPPVVPPVVAPVAAAPAAAPVEPAAPATTAAAPIKPSIFARAASMLKPQTELLQTIATHEGTIAAHVKTITAKDGEIAALRAELAETKAGADELETAMETLSQRKAIDLAAAQGVPAVPTDPAPAGATASDEIASLREQATAEPDAVKRSELHAKANRLSDARKNSGNN